MAESIEVGYAPAAFVGGLGIMHKYIIYTNSAGEQFYVRAGPGVITEPGTIITESGPYTKDTRDWDPARDPINPDPNATPHPRETIITGDDLSGDWQRIKDVMRDIDDRNIPYDPKDTNSNAAADEALRRSGLPAPTMDGPSDNWSPGSDYDMPGGDVAPGGRDFWDEFADWIREKSGFNDIEKAVNDWYNAARNWIQRKDPLTLDLDGDGLETVGIDPLNPILFDHDGDGIKNATGWIKPDDGFLVLDRNGNGTIDNGAELFGDSTPAYAGGQTADGFAALAQEDTNGDGLVNASDANWSELRVWQDANSDGISQEGELHTLEELNIAGFHVAKTENSTRLANGNQIADLGSYIKSDGSEGTVGQITGGIADIDLADNPFYRTFPDTIPLTEQAQALPGMQGSGMVRDLQEAVSLNPTLGTALADYAAADTKAGQLAKVDAVIQQWAASSNFQTSLEKAAAQGDRLLYLVPGLTRYDVLGAGFGLSSGGGSSGGSTGIGIPPTAEQLAQTEALKAQQIRITEILGFLEKFNGLTFVNVEPQGVRTGANAYLSAAGGSSSGTAGVAWGGDLFVLTLSATQIKFIESAYESLRQSVYDGLLLQTRLKPYLDAINLTLTDAGIGLDFTATDSTFQARFDAAPGEALRDLLDLQRIAGANLNGMGWDGLDQLRGWLVDAVNGADPALTATLVAALSEFNYPNLRTQGDGTAGNDLVYGAATGAVLNGEGKDIIRAANDAVFEVRRVG